MKMRRLARILGRTPWVVVALMAATVAAGCEDGGDVIEGVPSGPPAAEMTPPAISGGTLMITRDFKLAVAADGAGDQVYVVDLATNEIARTVVFSDQDEPGRVIEGADGQAHVALRRGGAIATIDLATGETQRTPVCPAPRGMDYQVETGELYVACAGGEVLTLSADLEITRSLRIDKDLRDIVAVGDKLMVSQFKSAKVIVLDTAGTEVRRIAPRDYQSPMLQRNFTPAVAWRLQKLPDGRAVMVHQRALNEVIPTGPSTTGQSYYGGNCDQVIVHGAVTVFDPNQDEPVTLYSNGGIGTMVLPVDIAVSANGQNIAVVAPGNEQLFVSTLDAAINSDVLTGCFAGDGQVQVPLLGEPVAVAYTDKGLLLVQTRQPAGLTFVNPGSGQPTTTEPLYFPGTGRRHWGHALFHRAAAPASPIACASCHPEGHEDGHVWQFERIGSRRTQDLSGGVTGTKPFHWDGDITTLHDLMGEVFVNRMGGAAQPDDRIDALGQWLDSVPDVAPSPAVDAASATRGEEIFRSTETGCTTCHLGELLTNNSTMDVGTGKAFQTPSLRGVATRAPYMHDGCAPTLHDRFTNETCGGGDFHGKTSQLTAEQIDDLVAYLETL
jgi:DNA-binding beta-propeller fold protein YncE